MPEATVWQPEKITCLLDPNMRRLKEIAAWQPEKLTLVPSYRTKKLDWEIIFDDTSTIDQSSPKLSIYFKNDPSTQPELLSTQDDQVQALIHQIRKSYIISNHENIANKLLALFNIAKEENPTCLGIAVDSLSNFYDFLRLYKNIKIPTLSLSPDYNIYASWRSKEQLFSAHFLPNGEVHFVLFKANKRHPKSKIRIMGTATNDTLMEITAPESLNDWVFDERR